MKLEIHLKPVISGNFSRNFANKEITRYTFSNKEITVLKDNIISIIIIS